MRHDSGDGVQGIGYELGGSIRFLNPASGVTMDIHGRVLLAHEDDYEEWGVGGLMRFDSGRRGRGLSLSVAPVYGEATSGVAQLWDQGVSRATMAAVDNTPRLRLDSEIGYGYDVFGGRALLTPYSGFSLVGEGAQRYRLGTRLEIGSVFKLSFEGARREASGDAAADHGAMLRLDWAL